ncbi:hypothetical protein Vadar_009003 [Vaccinium darrowii]|uniref:Uncharacterized protein n=1 Tax=Vaccinium darrowii TaxID=229202 RepID=A0ACB7YME3_9ERIC|nr:hypothetical protein Vadar_009003 [Vaccinium darrowii]
MTAVLLRSQNQPLVFKRRSSKLRRRETLALVERCIESAALMALAADPSSFGWPVNERVETGDSRQKTTSSWFEGLALLGLPLFRWLIFAMKA